MADGAERFRKWWEKNRALHNLRRRSAYAKKKSGLGEKEPEREATVPGIGMPSKEETLRGLRQAIEQESGIAPETNVETRPAKDVVGGIYRNDSGGVISKFAWEKLQRLKKEAKDGGYEYDEYSQ